MAELELLMDLQMDRVQSLPSTEIRWTNFTDQYAPELVGEPDQRAQQAADLIGALIHGAISEDRPQLEARGGGWCYLALSRDELQALHHLARISQYEG